MNDFVDRLVIEKDQLSGRLESLRKFMGDANFMKLPTEMRNLMINQEYHMTQYFQCLDKRLKLLS